MKLSYSMSSNNLQVTLSKWCRISLFLSYFSAYYPALYLGIIVSVKIRKICTKRCDGFTIGLDIWGGKSEIGCRESWIIFWCSWSGLYDSQCSLWASSKSTIFLIKKPTINWTSIIGQIILLHLTQVLINYISLFLLSFGFIIFMVSVSLLG